MQYKTALHFSALLLISTITACSATSDTTQFYTLKPIENLTETHYSANNKKSISIESLSIPRLLDRPQIISRKGKNQVFRSEYHQWGGSVTEEIKQLITSSIEKELLDSNYYILSSDSRFQPEYSLYIDVKRLDGLLGQQTSIEISWLLESRNTRFSSHGIVKLSESLASQEYSDYVSSLQALLVKSSQSISEQLLRAVANK